ncbi:uncharacterized protein G2W53_026232 [Senna tora]|uniref:Uncharacterized protein n=1 Tax=Senna tora TaxID=362788 RepID=A0A834WFH3_9FABA|nr:uncharacterized protein G2W53_026232 [Senna tora]
MRQKTCCASESNTSVRVVFANWSGFDAPIGVVLALEERGSCLNLFWVTNPGQISETFTNYEAKDLLRKQKTCCASESNTSICVVFANRSCFDAPIGVVFAWEVRGSCLNIFQTTNHGQISETFTNYEAKDLLRKSVDHVITYSGLQIAVGSQKPSRITRQKTCCVSESNTSVRVVFANRSGFDAPIGVVLAWEEHGSCLNIFRMNNRDQISEAFTNYEAKDSLRKNFHELQRKRLVAQVSQTRRFALYLQTGVVLMLQLESSWHGSESNTSVRVVFANWSGFDAPIGVVLALEERGSCLNLFWVTNPGQISETFTNYEAKDLLRKSVDHVLTYFGRQITVGSHKPSRITRQKTCCASESNTSIRVVFANRSYFDAPIGVVFAWEVRGSCLNIFQTTNHGQISETFTNYEAKDLLRNESNTSVRVVFANWSGFDAPIGVVLALEERGSCLNLFRVTNPGQISETFTNYEAKDLLRKSVDHVLTYFGRQIAVGSQKPSRITRQKTCCASESNTSIRVVFANRSCFDAPIGVVLAWESNTSIRVVFANRSGFDAPIGVVLAWEERGSCLNIFRVTNPSRISETFTNYEAKDLLRNESNTSVRVVFANWSGFDAPIGVVLALEERGSCLNLFWVTNPGQISETFTNYEAKDLLRKQKTCCASESNTSIRVVFANRSYFDAPIGVVFAWEVRGSCLNIFQTTNHGQISETFTNYEAKDLLRNESNTSVRVVFANWSGFDAPIGVVLALEERGSCLNLFRVTNPGQISETFTNYEAKDLLRKSVDHVLTYFGRQIAVGSQKPSRITRQKTCCASESNTSIRVVFANRSCFDAPIGVVLAWESNTSIRVVFANRSGFDAPIGVVLAWEERGSCLNIFRVTNPSRISETFTNYEAKDLLRNESNTSVRVVFANWSGFDAPIGVVLALEERGSCLNLFWVTNPGQISETFTNYEAKDLLRKSVDHVLTYFGRQITVGSHKPSRITRQKTCCASESNTSIRVVFANRSYFDAPIGVVFAWEVRGSCLNIFQTTNHGQISETFTNYEAKDLLRNESNTSVRVVFANWSGFDAPIGVVLALEERGSCLNLFRVTNPGQISETFTNYEAKDLLRKSVDHVLTYFGRQIAVGSQKPSRITRQKTCCASESNTSIRVVFANRSCFDAPIGVVLAWESNTSIRVVFANRSGFDAPIGVVLAWEERGSCLNIFRVTNPSRISETFTNYEAKDLLRNESNTSVRVVFANWSGFDAPIGVVLALEERGSCLNLFWVTNPGQISETFTNYEAKDLLRKSVDHVLTYFGRQITVGSHKPSRITRQKTCCASESNTSIRVVFANRSYFDAPIGVVFAWEVRGSCLNIFQTTNHGQISETFTNYEAKDLLRNESNTSVRVVFANWSGFDAPIGVVLALEERGSCLNLFRVTNPGQISETFTNYEAKDLLRKSVDHVLTYFGRQIAVGSQKPSRITRQKTCCASESNTSIRVVFANRSCFDAPIGVVLAWEKPSRITRQKTCCASESNTSVRVVFANRSGFDAPIGVVLAWEEHGSCLNIFRMNNRDRISEAFMNYEAKDSLRKNFHELQRKRLVAQVSQTRRFALYLQTGVVLMLQLESSWHGRCVDHVLTYFKRQIMVRSQKPSRITRQKTCCASESNTSVRVVFANRSGFDAPIGVVLAWEERGSCLNIFWMTNRGRI